MRLSGGTLNKLQRRFGLVVKAFVVPNWRIEFEQLKEQTQCFMQLLLSAPEFKNLSISTSVLRRLLCHPLLQPEVGRQPISGVRLKTLLKVNDQKKSLKGPGAWLAAVLGKGDSANIP
jgi:hypothetical protein